jgi:hypothetical protein
LSTPLGECGRARGPETTGRQIMPGCRYAHRDKFPRQFGRTHRPSPLRRSEQASSVQSFRINPCIPANDEPGPSIGESSPTNRKHHQLRSCGYPFTGAVVMGQSPGPPHFA